MKKIMILGGSEAQLPAILRAKELGYLTFNVDMYADAFCREYADEFEQISTLDYEGLDAAIERHKPDGIMTLASDRPVPIMARLAQKHGLRSISVETAQTATNKLLMRKRMKQEGVNIPLFYEVKSLEDLKRGINYTGLPAILKPVDSSGSRGISYIDETTDLEQAFLYSQKPANSESLLLEEYMKGREFSVESFTIDGKTTICSIIEKQTSGKPHFIETGHVAPPMITSKEQAEIEKLVLDVLRALNVENGPSTAEVMLMEEGAKLVEIGLRMAGDCIASDLIPLATSIDLVGAVIQQAVNDPVSLPEAIHHAACVRFLIKAPYKKAIDIVSHHPDCVRYYIDKANLNKELNSSADRLGYVICSDPDRSQAIKKAELALSQLEIIYEE